LTNQELKNQQTHIFRTFSVLELRSEEQKVCLYYTIAVETVKQFSRLYPVDGMKGDSCSVYTAANKLNFTIGVTSSIWPHKRIMLSGFMAWFWSFF
jgi:hypothetical protein